MPLQVRTGKDGGASALAKLRSFSGCVLAEYVWLDADGVTRSKTMTMTARQDKHFRIYESPRLFKIFDFGFTNWSH